MGKLRLPVILPVPECLIPPRSCWALSDWSLLFLQSGGSDDTELRYSSQYEERLDPFSSFSKRVRELEDAAC